MSVNYFQSNTRKKVGLAWRCWLHVFALISPCYFAVIFPLWKLLYESKMDLPAVKNIYYFKSLGRSKHLEFSHTVSFQGKQYDLTCCLQYNDVIEINLAWYRITPILKKCCPSVHDSHQSGWGCEQHWGLWHSQSFVLVDKVPLCWGQSNHSGHGSTWMRDTTHT